MSQGAIVVETRSRAGPEDRGWTAILAACALLGGMLARASAAPPNDDFANRVELSGCPVSAQGTNRAASTEPGEPTLGDLSTWWGWTAPAPGTYTITATVENFTPYLFVYSGSELASLTLVGSDEGDPCGRFTVQVAFAAVGGENYAIAVTRRGGGVGTIALSIASGRPPTVTVTAPASGATVFAPDLTSLRASPTEGAGEILQVEFVQTYGPQAGASFCSLGVATNSPFEVKVRLDYPYSMGGPQGVVLLARSLGKGGIISESPCLLFWITYPPPSNDDFTNRLPIAGSFFTVAATNTYATREPSDPTPGQASLWWTWTAPSSGVYSVAAVDYGSSLVPFVGVYLGSSLEGLTTVGTATGASPFFELARVSVNAVEGMTYSIAVSSDPDWRGELRLCVSPPDAPETAEFESIQVEPEPWPVVDGELDLHLWFRTGSGGNWCVEASTNLLTWQSISHAYPPNCRLGLVTGNLRYRYLGLNHYEPYVVPQLGFRLRRVSTQTSSKSTDADPTHRSTE